MRIVFVALVLLACSIPAHARGIIQGWCQSGNSAVITGGLTSTTKVQQSFPSCTVSVFIAGTVTPATIYSNMGGTPLATPFTANSDGTYAFYADYRVDVSFSGAGITLPFTQFNVSPGEEYGILNAANFAGSDIGAQINAALAAAGPVGNTVYVPAGTYNFSTGIVLNKPVQLVCSGRNTTLLNYTGTSSALTMHVNSSGPSSSPYMNGGLFGCDILGNANANAVGIHHIDTIGSLYDDVTVRDFTGTSGVGIWFDNQVTFSERVSLRKLSIFNNTKGFRFTNTGGTASQASFSYHRWSEVHFQVNDSQIAISAEGTGVAAQLELFHGHYAFSINFNDQVTPATGVKLTGAARMYASSWDVFMEETGGGAGAKPFDICPSCVVNGTDTVFAPGMTSAISPGGVLNIRPVILDPGGTAFSQILTSANLSGDRTATFPDGSGTVMYGNSTFAIIDNPTYGQYLRFKLNGANDWIFGVGASAAADQAEIYSQVANLPAFKAAATGATSLFALGNNSNINLNPTGTGNVAMGSASGISTGVNGNSDNGGALTVGGGGTVGYSFTKTYTIAPICVCSDNTAVNACKIAISTSALTITGTIGDSVTYVCFPRF